MLRLVWVLLLMGFGPAASHAEIDHLEDDDFDFENDDDFFLEDPSEDDWVWHLVFHELLTRGSFNLERLEELYECPSVDSNDLERVRDDCSVAKSSDGTCSAVPPSPPRHSLIPTEATWKLLEEAHAFAVNPARGPPTDPSRPDEESPSTQTTTLRSEPSRGLQIPFEVRYHTETPALGRGVYAIQDIPEGTVVWEATHTVSFPPDAQASSAHFGIPSYRRFLEHLDDRSKNRAENDETTHRHNWACDVLVWTYTSQQATVDPDWPPLPVLCLGLDHGSLLNDAHGNAAAANLRHASMDAVRPMATCQAETMKAVRDISSGEELRYEYGTST